MAVVDKKNGPVYRVAVQLKKEEKNATKKHPRHHLELDGRK